MKCINYKDTPCLIIKQGIFKVDYDDLIKSKIKNKILKINKQFLVLYKSEIVYLFSLFTSKKNIKIHFFGDLNRWKKYDEQFKILKFNITHEMVFGK